MSQAVTVPDPEQDIEISTILSARVMIPITCDRCSRDTDVSLSHLRALALIRCSHCGCERYFTENELRITKTVLASAGYYFTV
ncbi:hypothetical protein [Parathalassolituus penaei]|uniref:Uncharacterized protein n=1 Tax=Parathalassolituus penaei TaxID=2997323 RepID=A0A9X3EAW2_9GAMM|nr:hypothetical protein [Parathalassolituus penaei]MCY0964232.1 hypothetical protein [Parathalassolituus penaei]